MTGTQNVIISQGIRPAGEVDDKAVQKAKMYIQSNYIKRELKEEYSNDARVMELQKTIPSRTFLGTTELHEMLSDRIDRIRSAQRIEKINTLVEEMEYVKAIREIVR